MLPLSSLLSLGLLGLALQGAPPAAPAADSIAADSIAADSVYATAALRALIARAAAHNRTVPPALRAYRAALESEIAVVAVRPDGTEGAITVEQVRSEARWARPGRYEQHVVGYRAQAVGLTLSMLGFFRDAWTVPLLYGNRLALFFGADSATAPGRRPARRRPQLAVHPLATDRDAVYRFSGGDTVVTLGLGERRIPIVRIHVEPRVAHRARETLVFRGEIDLDATREQIIRMRGQFLSLAPARTWRERLAPLRFQSVAYAELVNAEFAGAYWLPAYQRLELQVAVPALGDARSVLRIVTRFRDHALETDSLALATADTLRPLPHRLTFASSDTLTHWADWDAALGTATAAVRGADFDDLAPDVWRPRGAPRVDLRVDRISDLLRFNRIEGLYTGYGAALRFRDAAPGLSVRGTAGWAWNERTARARARVDWARGRWMLGARAGRALDLTNDFRSTFDSGATLPALLFSQDDYDYVDRRSAIVSLGYALGRGRDATLRLEAGLASDRGAAPSVRRGLFRGDSAFRPNLGVDAGRYRIVSAIWELHRDVNAELVRPGVGALLRYDRAMGELAWERAELRLAARRTAGAVTYAARLDAGALWGAAPPPQQLFELGATQGLPGYAYKEFAGDRAVVLRGLATYTLGLWGAPVRLGRSIVLPAPAPALAVGLQSGWAEASTEGTRRAMLRLGTEARALGALPPARVPLVRATGGVRTTLDLGVRALGGAVFVGAARPIDRPARWRAVVSLAQAL